MNAIYIKVTLAVLLAGSCLGPSPSAKPTDEVPIETNLCAVLNNPEAFDGKMVRVGAFVKTSMHATVLYNSTSSKKGVALSVPSELEPAAEQLLVETFRPELFSGENAVWANFTGRIEWRPEERPALVLIFVEISDLKITGPSSVSDP